VGCHEVGSSPANKSISAFHMCLQKKEWIFHTIPRPWSSTGYETFGRQGILERRSGTFNRMACGISVDESNWLGFSATDKPKEVIFYRPRQQGKQLLEIDVALRCRYRGETQLATTKASPTTLWDLIYPCAPVLTTALDMAKKVPGCRCS